MHEGCWKCGAQPKEFIEIPVTVDDAVVSTHIISGAGDTPPVPMLKDEGRKMADFLYTRAHATFVRALRSRLNERME